MPMLFMREQKFLFVQLHPSEITYRNWVIETAALEGLSDFPGDSPTKNYVKYHSQTQKTAVSCLGAICPKNRR